MQSTSNREIGTIEFSHQSLDIDYNFYKAGKSSDNVSKNSTSKKIAKINLKKGMLFRNQYYRSYNQAGNGRRDTET